MDKSTESRHKIQVMALEPRTGTRRWKWIVGALPTLACATAMADLTEDYSKEIRPLMERKCHECHNAETTKGDVNLIRS